MNSYTIGALALVAVLLLVTYTYSSDRGSGDATQTAVTAPLSVENDRYDFGEIDIFGGKVQTTYTLRNEGTEDIAIIGAETSCMCTEGEIAGRTFGMHGSEVDSVVIPSGEEEVLTATFDPLAHGPSGTGKITRELMLRTNSTETPEVRLMFTGDVVKEQ